MGFLPTAEQSAAICRFSDFMLDRNDRVAMILRGSAGTGKTTLAAAIVKALVEMKQKIMLMAPTGRAAKVFAFNASMPAYTIHRRIYRQKTMTDMASPFSLNVNLATDTLFIVDEASMIANMGSGDTAFGTGCLLDDLIQFVYTGRNCRLMLIGDKWKVLILRDLISGTKRFGELKKSIGSVSQKVLTAQLRDMEESGLVIRKVYAEVPPRVEYSLTELGQSLKLILDAMQCWGEEYKASVK